jgi:hypothetical protein
MGHLGSTTHKAGKKRLLFLRHKSSRTIQVPSPSLQVRLRKLGNLHGRIHTKIGVDIDPIYKEGWQARRRQSILHNELTVDEPVK